MGIRAKDGKLPSFVLPDYEDLDESFQPFVRLPEPTDWLETLKVTLLTLTLFPLRLLLTVITLTTTNGGDCVMFRRGVFNAHSAVRLAVIRSAWSQCNTSWEAIPFRTLTWKVMSQWVNRLEVWHSPPYLPSEAEKADSTLFAYNVNILMAQMLTKMKQNSAQTQRVSKNGPTLREMLSRDNVSSVEPTKIYLTNRDLKVRCFHELKLGRMGGAEVLRKAKIRCGRDELIGRYLEMLAKDERYEFGEEELREYREYVKNICDNTQ